MLKSFQVRRRTLLLAVVAGALSGSVFSKTEAPDVLVRNLSDKVLQKIRTDKSLRTDAAKLTTLLETMVLPFFDMTKMTSLAVARDWNTATAEQKTALVTEFKVLLLRTYSNALTQYTDDKLEVQPLSLDPNADSVVVKTKVIRSSGGAPVLMDFALHLVGGEWKVFDVVIAGVSLVINYREPFKSQVRSGGVSGLIQYLKSKNTSTNS